MRTPQPSSMPSSNPTFFSGNIHWNFSQNLPASLIHQFSFMIGTVILVCLGVPGAAYFYHRSRRNAQLKMKERLDTARSLRTRDKKMASPLQVAAKEFFMKKYQVCFNYFYTCFVYHSRLNRWPYDHFTRSSNWRPIYISKNY